MEDNFCMDGGGGSSGGNVSDAGDGSGGNVSDGEPWGAADEASLARPPLTSCCAAQFLTGQERYRSAAWGSGTPALDY